jgi:hypothetical protein
MPLKSSFEKIRRSISCYNFTRTRTEDAGGTNKRRLIVFKCPDTTTIERLTDKRALLIGNGISLEIQYIPIEDLRIQLRAMEHAPGDNQMWNVAMDATEIYDISTHISIVISAPGNGEEFFVRHMLIPRI